jgi:hAT family C-terminal dimerisation region
MAVTPENSAMFPVLSSMIAKLLNLPVGTAFVERSFSTLNIILCSERCRLSPNHTCQLMQISIEGLAIPPIRNSNEAQLSEYDEFIDCVQLLATKAKQRHTLTDTR